jgi:glycosyltransferase involved in cell wall biosynthesis
MRVLFIMYAFPNLEEGFNMYTTLVEEFVKNGHDVTVLAPTKSSTSKTIESGIEILRVNSLPNRNVSKYLKGLSVLLLPYAYSNALNKFYPDKKYDLIISATPPITFAYLIAKIKKRTKAKFYLVLRDIFPQNAIDLGYMSRWGGLYNYFRFIEKKYYRLADYIGCMSEGNIKYLKNHNNFLQNKNIHILSNFQKPYLPKFDKKNWRAEFKLENKILVVFGGNMGKPQKLENVIELAKRCTVQSDVYFILIGEGYQMKKLSEMVKLNKLDNIIVQNSLSKTDYQDLISQCDIGLISLHEDFTIPNIPSKVSDYLNVGLPVLASIDSATDFGEILDNAKCGFYSLAGNHDEFKNNFDKLYNSKELRQELGRNGNNFFNHYLVPEVAYQTIINCINE